MTTAIKSISISLEMEEMLKKHKISASEAFRVGLSLILSEIGEPQYVNKLNIQRKLQSAVQIIQEQQNKIEKLEARNGLVQE